jgi:hypothetical protein
MNELNERIRSEWARNSAEHPLIVADRGAAQSAPGSAADKQIILYEPWLPLMSGPQRPTALSGVDSAVFGKALEDVRSCCQRLRDCIGFYVAFVELRTHLSEMLWKPSPTEQNRFVDTAIGLALDDAMSTVYKRVPAEHFSALAAAVFRNLSAHLLYLLLYTRRIVEAASARGVVAPDVEYLRTLFAKEVTEAQLARDGRMLFAVLPLLQMSHDELVPLLAEAEKTLRKETADGIPAHVVAQVMHKTCCHFCHTNNLHAVFASQVDSERAFADGILCVASAGDGA